MAKKAKIDLLDIQINEPDETSSRDNVVPDALRDETRGDKKLAWIRAWIGRLVGGRSKVPLILVVTVLSVAIAGGSIWVYVGKGKKESVPVTTPADAGKTVTPAGERFVPFDHFVVDLRDNKGNIRIAFCDIAVELEQPRAAGAADERVDVRNVIYAVLKRRLIIDGQSPEGRELIKIELKNEINRLLGEKTVKNVYITRFEVI